MFAKNNPNKAQNRIDTLIGEETKIDGDINFTGGLRIDGSIRGNVTESSSTASTLVLSESAHIEGAVTVSHVVVNGKIKGPVRANEYIELQTKSRVVGDVYYKSLEMHTGAVVEGKLIYLGEGAVESHPALLVDKD
ncbi:cell shape determination protein CcmA [Methylovorus sp. MM2]|uniref:bactofilin family protein n=1 Tax=Methylovorus sp. MM2 TaxID=1848038 RepID=UPI0007DF271B|nr:polymer-forming cytoskeletal protein [Methylovorus sp. MM2]OAM51927.1 cell shape determination protein CcmA [Methylovorus sp. MM2]